MAYLQLFVYRISKKDHEKMAQVLKGLATIYKKYGILRSEFYQLSNTKTFRLFESIGNVVSANQDEEVWVELEYYRDAKHREEFVAKINEEAEAAPFFSQLMGLLVKGYTPIQGEFIEV